jgi:peroxiredoxin
MQVKSIAVFVALGLAAAAIFTQTWAAPQSGSQQAEIGQAAPDFTLKDTYGKEFKLADFKDRIVVLEWVNQQCPVSKGHHDKRTMQDTYKKYASKGVIWLGIDTTAGVQPEKNRVYSAVMSLAYPILHDTDGRVAKAYGAKTTPHMFVIDKTGKLAYAGAIDDKGDTNFVAAALDNVLAGKAVSKPRTDSYGCGIKFPR